MGRALRLSRLKESPGAIAFTCLNFCQAKTIQKVFSLRSRRLAFCSDNVPQALGVLGGSPQAPGVLGVP